MSNFLIGFFSAAALMTMGIILITVGLAMFLDEVTRGVRLAKDSQWKFILGIIFTGSCAMLGALTLIAIVNT